jgi:AcrR family transcriptional regulator
MGKISPRQRRREKTKQAILETAQELVAEKGLDGLSIREIARRIDYSPAGLYEYFESKEDIVAAICANVWEQVNAAFKAVSPELPPTCRLVEMSLAYVKFAVNNPEQFLLVAGAAPSALPALDESADNSPYPLLLDTVQAALDSGKFSPAAHTAETIAFSLWALMHGRVMLQLTVGHNFHGDFDLVHKQALETFLRGLKPA